MPGRDTPVYDSGGGPRCPSVPYLGTLARTFYDVTGATTARTLARFRYTRAVGVSAANGIPENTFNYQAKRTRYGINAQYSLSRRYALYISATDVGGFVQDQQRYAPDTPDYAKGQRWQELGFYTNIGVRATF